MIDRSPDDLLRDRAALSGLEVSEHLATRVLAYYRVLTRWNRKINLTSLTDPAESIDRLLLEPIAAAGYLPHGVDLIDLGSGGGSPAIPLALALGAPQLVMVESRSRKVAFLREALREVALEGSVEAARFEDVASLPQFKGGFGVASVRAVRPDAALFGALVSLLASGGTVGLFRSVEAPVLPPNEPALVVRSTVPLISATRSSLTILDRR